MRHILSQETGCVFKNYATSTVPSEDSFQKGRCKVMHKTCQIWVRPRKSKMAVETISVTHLKKNSCCEYKLWAGSFTFCIFNPHSDPQLSPPVYMWQDRETCSGTRNQPVQSWASACGPDSVVVATPKPRTKGREAQSTCLLDLPCPTWWLCS